jgi:hypothetical protein
LMEYEAFLDSEGVPPIPDCALLWLVVIDKK